uniref:General transcription factor IIH subunit 2 n=1 Tax=Monodelphis domestica TaxID=13616 RepID=A0A5F8GSX9_MONDO
MDEEPEKTKRWEGGYERTWEILKEDESGSLKATIEDILFKAKRKRVFEHHGQVQLGMMRHLYVVVDGSRTMEDQDLKPNRLTCTLKETTLEERQTLEGGLYCVLREKSTFEFTALIKIIIVI